MGIKVCEDNDYKPKFPILICKQVFPGGCIISGYLEKLGGLKSWPRWTPGTRREDVLDIFLVYKMRALWEDPVRLELGPLTGDG